MAHHISSYTGDDGGGGGWGGCYSEATSHRGANPPYRIQPAKTTVPARIKREDRAYPVHRFDGNEAAGLT